VLVVRRRPAEDGGGGALEGAEPYPPAEGPYVC